MQIDSQFDKEKENQNTLDRRKALGLAAAGLAGVFFANVAGGQNVPNHIENLNSEILPDIDKRHKEMQVDNEPYLKNVLPKVKLEREDSNQMEWLKIEKVLSEAYFTEEKKLSGNLNPQYLGITNGFKFIPSPVDLELIQTHIEPLIDQAADLLDRCLRDRATWDELSNKMFNLALELNEYKELDKIHKEEEDSGLYDHQYKQSLAEYNAEVAYLNTNKVNSALLENIISFYFDSKKIIKLYNANVVTAWLGGLVPYKWDTQKFDSYLRYGFNGGSAKSLAEHYADSAGTINWHSLNYQKETLELQKAFIKDLVGVSTNRLVGLKAQTHWDEVNRDFQRRRTKVSRDLEDIKSKAAIDADGVLNYAKRLPPLKERFTQDFRDALARIKVVELGLKNIYGLEMPAPKSEADVDYYDQCLKWTRKVIQWILKFSRKEQNTILTISVRDMVTNDFTHMSEKGKWSFSLANNNFPGMCNIRLRGLSINTREKLLQKNRVWQFKVTPPAKTEIKHFLTKETVQFNQSFLEPCIFGRVFERESTKTADIIGLTSLYNASPIGNWHISSLGTFASLNTDKIQDIELDFHLAFRWDS
jgi:hypothetical protein